MFRIKKQNKKSSLFRFPSNAIQIVDFKKEGRYVIKTSVAIDAGSALIQGVAGIRVRLYPISPSALTNDMVVQNVGSPTDSTVFTHNVNKVKQSVKAFENFIDQQVIDIASGINNAVNPQNNNIRGETVEQSMAAKQIQGIIKNSRPDRVVLQSFDISRAPISEGSTVGISAPTTINNLMSSRPRGPVLREYVFKIIYELGLDPADVARFPFPISIAQNVTDGVISNDKLSAGVDIGLCAKRRCRHTGSSKNCNIRRNETTTNIGELTRDVIRLPNNKNYVTMYKRALSENTSVSKDVILIKKFKGKYQIFNTHLSIDFKFVVPGGMLTFLFEAIDSTGVVVGHKYKHVNYSDLKQVFERPVIAPSISASWHSPGVNTLTLIQNDPYANEIAIYRKIISLRNNIRVEQSGFKLVRTIPVSSLNGEIYIADKVIPNYGAVLYRAVSRSPNKHVSYDFDSTVVVTRGSVHNLPITFDPFFATAYIVCHSTHEGIIIKISGLDTNYNAFHVVVQDISGVSNYNFSSLSQRIVANRPFLVSDANTSLEITDKNVIVGRKYRYCLLFIDSQGIKYESSICYVHDHQIIEKPRAKLRVTDSKLVVLGQDTYQVEFTTSANFLKTGLEKIHKLLQDLGASDSFISDIDANREQFSSILQIRVERYDLLTGDIIDLGFHNPGKAFIDSPLFRDENGIPALERDRKYRYDISLYSQSPMTIFPGLKQDSIDNETLKAFSRDTYKFFSPSTLREGLLGGLKESNNLSVTEFPDFANVKGNAELFSEGNLYIKESFEISVPSSNIEIINFTTKELNDGRLLLVWNFRGDISDIDHFIIFCDYAGIKAPVGTAHTFMGLDIKFIDNNLAGALGSRTYTILPVLKDFSFGDESSSLTYTKRYNMDDVEMISS